MIIGTKVVFVKVDRDIWVNRRIDVDVDRVVVFYEGHCVHLDDEYRILIRVLLYPLIVHVS